MFGVFHTWWVKANHLPKCICVLVYTHVWLVLNIFVKSQTCVEKKLFCFHRIYPHVWKHTCVKKKHCRFAFLWSGTNQTYVAFTKHIPNTKVCDVENTHVCKIQTCVCFFIQVVLLFVFAIVFEFFIFDMIHYIYIYHFRCVHAISDIENTFKIAFKK